MDKNSLKQSLKTLHTQLEDGGEVDEELRQLLHVLDDDIQNMLSQPAEENDFNDLAERTREIAANFAARHPQVESTLRELGNILANIGV